MTELMNVFLQIARSGLFEADVSDPGLSSEEWEEILRLAQAHSILPLIYDRCCKLSSFARLDRDVRKSWKRSAIAAVSRQNRQTNELLTLLLEAQGQGMDPVVVKGITCRVLYPHEYLRPSADEDFLILPEQAEAFHRFFLRHGLKADDPDADAAGSDELSYHKPDSPIYIELHKYLFPRSSLVYGSWNRLFEGAMGRTVRIQVQDVSVKTLHPTDHMLFLLLHALKHFLHSGFGIRIVCDIGLFAKAHQEEIDWEKLRKDLQSVQAFEFSCAVFNIAYKYLLPQAAFYRQLQDWHTQSVKEDALLEDIFDSGVLGASSDSRLHSSSMTLHAAGKQKAAGKAAVLHSVFVPRSDLEGRYPYLRKYPFLLPAAWLQRVMHYLREQTSAAGHGAGESIRIGQERIRLLEAYGIIKK